MTYYTMEDAQKQLQKLITSALSGEKVVITLGDRDEVELVAIKKSSKPRKPGSAEGLIWMSDDFDDPLPDFEEYME